MVKPKKSSIILRLRTAVKGAFRNCKCSRRKPKMGSPRYQFDSKPGFNRRSMIQTRTSRTCDYSEKLYFAKRRKHRPSTGSNFSKTPILSEIPKIINPAAWIASKTQKDTKPIKN